MLNRLIATSLIAIVPEKLSVLLTLLPGSAVPTTVKVNNAWFKSMDIRLTAYGGVNLQGDETRIRIPDKELNPAGNSREIRPRDTIAVGSDVYQVITARLMTVRTIWDCVVRKEMS